jgi:hypothetical protein
MCKKNTKSANGSDILKVTQTVVVSNIFELKEKYNALHNEGGEGYIPDDDYFKSIGQFEEKEIISVFS